MCPLIYSWSWGAAVNLLQAIDTGHNVFSVAISSLALAFSLTSVVLALRADGRARDSIRPFVSTGVSIIPEDMSVSLSNYGAGLAIITRIVFSRQGMTPQNSLAPITASSRNFELGPAIYFVQEQYCLRPGDTLTLASAKPSGRGHLEDALAEWERTLTGVIIEVNCLDIFGRSFQYRREI